MPTPAECLLNRDEPPYGSIIINCECCKLPQRIRDRDGAIPRMCDTCNVHQGQLPERRAQRAESHEAMLRERLDHCRASEAKATAAADSAAERIRSALSSRGALANRLYKAAQAGSHTCPAIQIGLEAPVVKWARTYQMQADEDRRRYGYVDDYD